MAKAIQCDRCKKYASVPDSRTLPLPLENKPEWRQLTATKVLCDACGTDFDTFLANEVTVVPGNGGETAPAIQQPTLS
jgi:hypothetical protein